MLGLYRCFEISNLAVEAVGMWESRRDFQGVWEGWKAGILAFHAFHTLSFPWPVLETRFTSSQFAAKALFGNWNHLSEMATFRPCGCSTPVDRETSILSLNLCSLLSTALAR